MPQPTVLLFDLGGVLVENVGFERLNALLTTSLPLEELKARWLASTAVRSFEVGACSPDSFASALVEEWQLALSPNAFIEAFASWPKGLYPGAPNCFRNCVAGTRWLASATQTPSIGNGLLAFTNSSKSLCPRTCLES